MAESMRSHAANNPHDPNTLEEGELASGRFGAANRVLQNSVVRNAPAVRTQAGYANANHSNGANGATLLLGDLHFGRCLTRSRRGGSASLRGQLPKRTLAPRLAPSRQMGAVQPLAAKQPTHLAGLRTALRLLEDPQPILRGELAPLRPGHDLRARGRSCAPGPGGVGCAGESIFTTTTVIIPITAAPPCPPERTAPAQLSDDDGSM